MDEVWVCVCVYQPSMGSCPHHFDWEVSCSKGKGARQGGAVSQQVQVGQPGQPGAAREGAWRLLLLLPHRRWRQWLVLQLFCCSY